MQERVTGRLFCMGVLSAGLTLAAATGVGGEALVPRLCLLFALLLIAAVVLSLGLEPREPRPREQEDPGKVIRLSSAWNSPKKE